MTSRSKLLVFITILIVAIGYFSFIRPDDLFNNLQKEVIKVDTVSFHTRNVYLVDIRRGFSYVVKKITFSKELLDAKIDEEKEYIFKTDLDIFYKINADTLVIYTRNKSKVPLNFPNDIIIKQVELDNPNYMNLYDEYEKRGIKYF